MAVGSDRQRYRRRRDGRGCLTSVIPFMVPHAVGVMPRPSVYHVRLPEDKPSRGAVCGAAATMETRAVRRVVA